MFDSKKVLILDLHERINLSDGNVLSRHQKYANLLAKATKGEIQLVVLHFRLFAKTIKEESSGAITFLEIPYISLYLPSKMVNSKIISSIFSFKSILVAGDPWESAILAIIIQRRFKGKSLSIQVQAHSDLSKEFFRSNIRNRIRELITSTNLSKANSVRLTSNEHRIYVHNRFGVIEEKCFVSPLTLNLDYDKIQVHTSKRPHSVGFVGRIHDERGLDLQIAIIEEVCKIDRLLRFHFFGSGPRKNYIVQELKKRDLLQFCNFFGEVKEESIEEMWRQIGVLVSTSPTEAYGRAMREALVHGVPVISRGTLGFQSLKSEPMEKPLFELMYPIEYGDLSELITKCTNLTTDSSYFEMRRTWDDSASDLLIRSWIELAKD